MMHSAITAEDYEVSYDPIVVTCRLTIRDVMYVEGMSVCWERHDFDEARHKAIALQHAQAKLPDLEGRIYEDLLNK